MITGHRSKRFHVFLKKDIYSKNERNFEKNSSIFFGFNHNLVTFKNDSCFTNFRAGFQLVSFKLRIDLDLNMKIIFRRIDNRDKTTSHWATRCVCVIVVWRNSKLSQLLIITSTSNQLFNIVFYLLFCSLTTVVQPYILMVSCTELKK